MEQHKACVRPHTNEEILAIAAEDHSECEARWERKRKKGFNGAGLLYNHDVQAHLPEGVYFRRTHFL